MHMDEPSVKEEDASRESGGRVTLLFQQSLYGSVPALSSKKKTRSSAMSTTRRPRRFSDTSQTLPRHSSEVSTTRRPRAPERYQSRISTISSCLLPSGTLTRSGELGCASLHGGGGSVLIN